MPAQSRGTNSSHNKPPPLPHAHGFSQSTPNLPTRQSIQASASDNSNTSSATASRPPSTLQPEQSSPDIITSPSEPASIDEFELDDASDDSDDEDEDLPHLPQRPTLHQHSFSHTYLAPSSFAPPFYGRPPTPLPPSPSLTSLLRPNFSSANSRPTTPDPSSDEGAASASIPLPSTAGTQTPNSTLYRSATKPIPRASPKVPTYEYYGFTLYLTSSLAFIVYLLWSFLPSPFLHQLGIYYYPNRWWALAIPAWTVMFIVYIYVALACYNIGYLTLPLQSIGCLVDEAANVAIIDTAGKLIHEDLPSWDPAAKTESKGYGGHHHKKGRSGGRSRQGSLSASWKLEGSGQGLEWRALWREGTDAVMDIPLGGVCEILYGEDNER